MSGVEFKAWSDIKRFEGIHIIITEKLDGSNASIVITESEIAAQSRNRILTLDHDNYGFALWVEENKEELREKLGIGYHYGEWYGASIGTKYGMKEKRLALFDIKRAEIPILPKQVDVVPVLYNGLYKENIVEEIMNDLKTNGSKMVPGWMKPEGVVVHFPQFGSRRKKVFSQEEVAWRGEKKPKTNYDKVDHFERAREYLQPERLKKLFVREERYSLDYPETLPEIASEYIKDLIKETENVDEAVLYSTKRVVFSWIKQIKDS